MLSFLPAPLLAFISGAIFVANTIFWCVLIYAAALGCWLRYGRKWRQRGAPVLNRLAECWISGNHANLAITQNVAWDVDIPTELHRDQTYLVVANHRTWLDIVVLQRLFHRKIPFLRFFIKQQLVYVPFLGLAWWILGYPLLRRYPKAVIDANPELRERDIEATRQACALGQGGHITIFNFLEGTRYTPAKAAAQQTPYRHLLKARSGGFANAVEVLRGSSLKILDVTIAYPREQVNLWDLFCGRIDRVRVFVREVPLPEVFLTGDYRNDSAYRAEVRRWLDTLWGEKDALLMECFGTSADKAA